MERHRRNNCRTEKLNNALMENRNAIIKLVTKVADGYRNWDRFRNRCMLVLEKGIDDFENDKDDGSVKMVKKKVCVK
uniref:transposase n=1 Tax=Holdemanella biformis TaxID=1735 RepID=UPI0040267A20